MKSTLNYSSNLNHSQKQLLMDHHKQPISGLLRFRSAPPTSLPSNEPYYDTTNFHDKSPAPESRRTPPEFSSPREVENGSSTGFFSRLNGYNAISGVGNGINREVTASPNRLRTLNSLSSRLPSSLGLLSRILEIDNESSEPSDPDDKNQFYGPFGSWNNSQNLSGSKRDHNDTELFSGFQNDEDRNGMHSLSHRLSLPSTFSEMDSIQKMLQFQDSIPCKIRAKRGCATHPRSIAERVRRTRITERMRKLQELVPNMDKQTNTADMLDLAVDYIKDLQQQFKTLTDIRAKCTCLSSQNHSMNGNDKFAPVQKVRGERVGF